MELFQQGVELAHALLAVAFHQLQHGENIFLHRQAAKNAFLLRQIANAKAGAAIHGQGGDIMAVNGDAALVGGDKAGDHVKHRGLAGAVWSKQTNRLAASHRQRSAAHHRAALVAFPHGMGGQPAFGGGRLRLIAQGSGSLVIVGLGFLFAALFEAKR